MLARDFILLLLLHMLIIHMVLRPLLLLLIILNIMLLRQFSDESNDAYLTRFKSMIETLKIQ